MRWVTLCRFIIKDKDVHISDLYIDLHTNQHLVHLKNKLKNHKQKYIHTLTTDIIIAYYTQLC